MGHPKVCSRWGGVDLFGYEFHFSSGFCYIIASPLEFGLLSNIGIAA
jgi:hypothetical protein